MNILYVCYFLVILNRFINQKQLFSDDEMDDIDSEGDEPDLSGVDENMDDDDNYNKLYEDNWTKSNKNEDEGNLN
jgi:hypothetical protein